MSKSTCDTRYLMENRLRALGISKERLAAIVNDVVGERQERLAAIVNDLVEDRQVISHGKRPPQLGFGAPHRPRRSVRARGGDQRHPQADTTSETRTGSAGG